MLFGGGKYRSVPSTLHPTSLDRIVTRKKQPGEASEHPKRPFHPVGTANFSFWDCCRQSAERTCPAALSPERMAAWTVPQWPVTSVCSPAKNRVFATGCVICVEASSPPAAT